MNTENEVQQNSYFEYRNIDSSVYEDFNIPFWIKTELKDNSLNILDYGCGFGQTIQALKKDGYKNCYGVDIENSAIAFCEKNGLTVKKLNLQNLYNPYSFKFDVIILSHIIEHIPKSKIIDTLILIKNEFLEKNGKLLVAVPNAQSNTDSYWAYEDWTHTTLFTSGSLYYVLKSAGFNSIEFLDIDCSIGDKGFRRIIRKFFLYLYKFNKSFWNKITCSSYHKPSLEIFSYEIKVKAQ